ncbi:MAG TPA: RGCVC family protein [Jatrophihabitantaceae bacterium]|jgi:hypothetical protein
MTATRRIAVEAIATDSDSEMCDVCGHALALHDRVAVRYCEATLQNALSRTCVCSTKNTPGSHYRR